MPLLPSLFKNSTPGFGLGHRGGHPPCCVAAVHGINNTHRLQAHGRAGKRKARRPGSTGLDKDANGLWPEAFIITVLEEKLVV
mmetsp:Transcript_4524/g.5409  ORF Transcript_4524/g.5409 Transcript_4524/m.5409 type:complete len:83 (-) Transcript_4524:203-451(-)